MGEDIMTKEKKETIDSIMKEVDETETEGWKPRDINLTKKEQQRQSDLADVVGDCDGES